ncbi:UNVERIFIED_CONTAM: hypothetical protein HDU68_005055 [Siphonaria sp. JEL0065]|nr:hypothetical protein HDU68_005055 [Siphonaria sp. JEL0065]
MGKDVDADGWAYAVHFRARDWAGAVSASHYVARRAWVRLRRQLQNNTHHHQPINKHHLHNTNQQLQHENNPAVDQNEHVAVLKMAPLVRSCTLDRQKVDAVAACVAQLSPTTRIPPYAVAAVLAEMQYDKSRLQALKHLLPFLDKEGAASAVFLITHHCNRLELLNALGKDSFLAEFLNIQ